VSVTVGFLALEDTEAVRVVDAYRQVRRYFTFPESPEGRVALHVIFPFELEVQVAVSFGVGADVVGGAVVGGAVVAGVVVVASGLVVVGGVVVGAVVVVAGAV
jgi:hypothetical protein